MPLSPPLPTDWPAAMAYDASPLAMPPLGTPPRREARELRAMHRPESPAGLRVRQISGDPHYASSHIYMESPVFTPDSRRFVFQRGSQQPTTINMKRRRRQYWLCDMDDGCSIRPLTDEPWATAPAISPDGLWCYYFTNRLDPRDDEAVELRRVSLTDFHRETVVRLDGVPAGAPSRPSQLYSLATIRADGGAIATAAFFGDGVREPGLHGILVVDLATGRAHAPLLGPTFCNTHPQYYRGSDPRHLHDLMVQENFCDTTDALGEPVAMRSGCYLRVIADDGSDYRTVPTGDAREVCHGHQEWRGTTDQILVGVDWYTAERQHLGRPIILARAVADTPDSGVVPRDLPGADSQRANLARAFAEPWFAHTTFDLSGDRFATDWWDIRQPASTASLHIGSLSGGLASELRMRYLLNPMIDWGRDQFTHPHPCLSPDGQTLLFNSTYDGTPQVYLATGFDYP